jgi:predicted TIM-barrel fold metal-dependent hydrolase
MFDRVISADCHVTEPMDLWKRELPPSMRDRGPRLEVRGGRMGFMVEDHMAFKMPPIKGLEDRPDGPVEARSPGDDVASRSAALEQDGVWGEVLYPQAAFFCTFEVTDPELQKGICTVYNDWLAATFGADPRFAGIALLPALDVAAAVRELERAADLGLPGALLPAHADYRPYNDMAWDPVWERAAGLGMPLHFHAGTGRTQRPFRGAGGAVVNYVVTVSSLIETSSVLCASGVLARHPTLNVGMVECGAGWLAWTLDSMDEATREHAAWVRPKLPELPSEYFRRQGFVTFQRDPVGLANVARTGARCLLWGSDHPHPEGTFPESRRILDEQMQDVPSDVARRIILDNAIELYGFPA